MTGSRPQAHRARHGASLRIALVGGGLGGLTAALALLRNGFDAHVFEQADRLREFGGGIGLSPNALKILRALGLEQSVRAAGAAAAAIVGRDWTTAQELFRVPLKGVNEARFGLSNVQICRGDLLDILAAAVPKSRIHLNSACVSVASSDRRAILELGDGTRGEFDLVVGCDGIHSRIRAALHGAELPRFTGNMCWRALIAADSVRRQLPADVTNWMGPRGHVVTYYVRARALVNVVAVRETSNWSDESWVAAADADELLAAYPVLHGTLRSVLERVDGCFKWGLFDRDPLATWSDRRITLLGDAAHPMLPFLGQGAAMAIEDAYVLARELANSPRDVAAALRAYEAERVPRTTHVQIAARARGQALHFAPVATTVDFDPEWLYGYDATRGRT